MKHYLFTSTTIKYIWKSTFAFFLFTMAQSFVLTYVLMPDYQSTLFQLYSVFFLSSIIVPLWLEKIHPKTLIEKKHAIDPIPAFLIGYVGLVVVNETFTYFFEEWYVIDQANQQMVEIMMDEALFLMAPMVILLAPIVEELVFREWIPKFLRNVGRKIKINAKYAEIGGFILGSLLFTLIHSPTGLQGWVIYGGLSIVLLVIRLKYSIQAVIMIHFYYNTFQLITILLEQ